MTSPSVAVRIIAADGTTVRADLNDQANGLFVESPPTADEDNVRDLRTSAPRVDGSFRVAEAYDDSIMALVVRVEGSSWVECTTRWQAVRTAYRAESVFYLETVIDGVTTRWQTERPDSSQIEKKSGLLLKRQTYQLRFRVQPNPTITV